MDTGPGAEPLFGTRRSRPSRNGSRTRRAKPSGSIAKGDLNALKLVSESVESSVLSLPNRPLEPSKLPVTVDLGGIQAVIESYPGHTPSDLIVRVPQRNVVFTGDLLFNGMYPATSDANLGGWRKALETFSGYDKETLFVPGHGPLCGPEGIATLRSVFDDLAEQAAKDVQGGDPRGRGAATVRGAGAVQGFPHLRLVLLHRTRDRQALRGVQVIDLLAIRLTRR